MLEGDLTVGVKDGALDKFDTSEIGVDFKLVPPLVRNQVERPSIAMLESLFKVENLPIIVCKKFRNIYDNITVPIKLKRPISGNFEMTPAIVAIIDKITLSWAVATKAIAVSPLHCFDGDVCQVDGHDNVSALCEDSAH